MLDRFGRKHRVDMVRYPDGRVVQVVTPAALGASVSSDINNQERRQAGTGRQYGARNADWRDCRDRRAWQSGRPRSRERSSESRRSGRGSEPKPMPRTEVVAGLAGEPPTSYIDRRSRRGDQRAMPPPTVPASQQSTTARSRRAAESGGGTAQEPIRR